MKTLPMQTKTSKSFINGRKSHEVSDLKNFYYSESHYLTQVFSQNKGLIPSGQKRAQKKKVEN
jgi:hypothetical protein